MSDFLKGVGTGLIGSNGISRAVNSFALAPYIAAAKEKQAMSEAALADMRAAQAGLGHKKLNVLDGILTGSIDPTLAAQAYSAISGSAPYGNGNAPGLSLNKITGDQLVGNASAQKAWVDKYEAERRRLLAAAESSRAAAANSYSNAKLHNAEVGLVPYKRNKLVAETDYRNDRRENPQRYSRQNTSRSSFSNDSNWRSNPVGIRQKFQSGEISEGEARQLLESLGMK